jgi:anti-sigma-K factor RskA
VTVNPDGPPLTLDQRRELKAARWALVWRWVCTVAAVAAPLVLALALYVAQRGETGWGLVLALGSLLGLAAAVKRFS